MRDELITYLVGSAGAIRFGAAMLFALVGLAIRLTQRSSIVFIEPWDWSNWKRSFRNHAKRLVNTLLVVYVFLRFPMAFITPEVVEVIPEEFVFLFAIVVGFSFDRLSKFFAKRASRIINIRSNGTNDS